MNDNEKIKKGLEFLAKIREEEKKHNEKIKEKVNKMNLSPFNADIQVALERINFPYQLSEYLLSELFEWKETDTEGVIKLYYKHFWTNKFDQNTITVKAINNAPYISSWEDKKQYVEKGQPIKVDFEMSYGSPSFCAPESGVIEILVPCKFSFEMVQMSVQMPDETFVIRKFGSAISQMPVQVPDDTFILSLDYRKESIDKYFEQQEKERLEEERFKEEWERKEMAKKILEKERKKRLNNEVLQELTEKGLITPK